MTSWALFTSMIWAVRSFIFDYFHNKLVANIKADSWTVHISCDAKELFFETGTPFNLPLFIDAQGAVRASNITTVHGFIVCGPTASH
jgi:hypothetical protein